MNEALLNMAGLLNSATPLMLAGLGALLSDLSGALVVFVEGFMVTGAFFSWVLAGRTGSAFLGTLISALLAGFAGWALARFVKQSGANPFIAGLAFNLAASGLTLSLSAAWFGTKGVLFDPSININIPGNITGVNPFTFIALSFTLVIAIGLKRSVPGFRLRSSGISPDAAEDRGVQTGFYREGAWALAAFLASIAGAALTFRVGAYAPGGIAGRGWIALATVYLGFRNAWGVAIAAIVFSLAERLGYGLQGFGALPATAILGLPSALALVFYALSLFFRKETNHDSAP